MLLFISLIQTYLRIVIAKVAERFLAPVVWAFNFFVELLDLFEGYTAW